MEEEKIMRELLNKNSKKKGLVWCIVILSVAAVLTVAIGIVALISSKAKTEPTPAPVNIKAP